MDWSIGAEKLAVGASDGRLHVLAFSATDAPERLLPACSVDAFPRERITGCAWDEAGSVVAACSESGSIALWRADADGDGVSLTAAARLDSAHGGGATALRWHPDEPLFATGGGDGGVAVWRWGDGGAEAAARGSVGTSDAGEPITALAWSGGGAALAAASGKRVSAWTWDRVAFGAKAELHWGEAIHAVAWHPHDDLLACGAARGAVLIAAWDAAAGALQRGDSSGPGSGAAASLAWFGDRIVKTTVVGTVEVHAPARGRDRVSGTRVLHRDASGVAAPQFGERVCAWSSEGAWLAVGSHQRELRVLGVGAGGRLRQLWRERGAHGAAVTAVAWATEGTAGALLASAAEDGGVGVWTWQGGELTRAHAVALGGGAASCLQWAGALLAAGTLGGALVLWRWQRGALAAEGGHAPLTAPLLQGSAQALGVASGAPPLVALGVGSGVAVFSSSGGARPVWVAAAARADAHSDAVTFCAWSHGGTRLLTASWDGTVKAWAWEGGALSLLASVEARSDGVRCAALSPPDGRWLATTGLAKLALIWSWDGEALHRVAAVGDGFAPTTVGLAWRDEGRELAAAAGEGEVRLVHWRGCALRRRAAAPASAGNGLASAATSPDGCIVAIGDRRCGIALWRVEGEASAAREVGKGEGEGEEEQEEEEERPPRLLHHLATAHARDVTALTWRTCGRVLASGGFDSTVKVWRVGGGTDDAGGATGGARLEEAASAALPEFVTGLAWSADGAWLLASSLWGPAVRVLSWDGGSSGGECNQRPRGKDEAGADGGGGGVAVAAAAAEAHGKKGVVAAWAPGGRHILSAGYDGALRVWAWDARAREIGEAETARPAGAGRFHALAVSACGRWVATARGDFDATVEVWHWDGAALRLAAAAPGATAEKTTALVWGPRGRWLLALSPGKQLALLSWDGAALAVAARRADAHAETTAPLPRARAGAGAAFLVAGRARVATWALEPPGDAFTPRDVAAVVAADADEGARRLAVHLGALQAGMRQSLLAAVVSGRRGEVDLAATATAVAAALGRHALAAGLLGHTALHDAWALRKADVVRALAPSLPLLPWGGQHGAVAELVQCLGEPWMGAVAGQALDSWLLVRVGAGQGTLRGVLTFGQAASPPAAAGAAAKAAAEAAAAAAGRGGGGGGDDGDGGGGSGSGGGTLVPVEVFALAGRGTSRGGAFAASRAALSRSLLHVAARRGHVGEFDSIALHALIRQKWSAFGRRTMLGVAGRYLLLLLLFLLVTTLGSDASHTLRASTSERAVEVAEWAAFGCFAAGWAWFAAKEARQAASEGTWAYLRQGWNWVDAPTLALLLASAVAARVGAPGWHVAGAVAALLGWAKMLYFLRAFDGTGALVRLVTEVVASLRWFLVVVAVVVAGFANSFFLLLQPSRVAWPAFAEDAGEIERPFSTPLRALGTAYRMLLGDWDFEAIEGAAGLESALAWLLFVGFTFIAVVVLLNLLIAILSDSYEEARDRAVQSIMFERAQLLLEIERELPAAALADALLFPNWLFVVLPRGSLADPSKRGAQQEWTGRLRAMKAAIRKSEEALRDRIGEAERRAERAAQEQRVQVAAIMARLEALAAAVEGTRAT